MIDALLKKDLPHSYGLGRPKVRLNYRHETGVFELGDSISCSRCKGSGKFPERTNCNERVMRVNATNNDIVIIEHEDYLNQFNGSQFGIGGRCDLIMFDNPGFHKIAFCDLGCYSEAHVEKKQKEAHRQTSDSFLRFIHKTCGKSFVDQFSEKLLIFGRRDPAIDPNANAVPQRGNTVGNMRAFLTTPVSKSKYAVATEYIEGIFISYVIVNYPESYIW